ncbi:HDOD domain-containing protein [Stenotrophomonas chelatiphaga]|uniref:HDOD domain-containing protein n=1 Tax=Stenotrophomonas chelatiphaga TaxID=517011 RepID=UPI0007103374|nr:HDOD domain-containing protein [Stenotrophomonas chelatiphaga]
MSATGSSGWAGWWGRLFGRAGARHATQQRTQRHDGFVAEAVAPAAMAAGGNADADAEARLHSGLYALALHPALDGGAACHGALLEATRQALLSRDWSARQLPRRPQLLPQLIQTVNDPESSARATAAIIGQDPVLTGNLLRIANSPAFRMQERPVDSLQRAITLVGTEGIRQIISAVLVQPVMHLQCSEFPQFSTIIWEHALLSSRAAADHARTVSQQDPFAAQWLGLTQGLGAALVMKQLLQEAQTLQVPLDYPTAEALLRQWTLPVAQRVAAAWELPAPVHEALQASNTNSGLPRTLRFARAAAAASLLARHGHIGKSQGLAWLEQLPGTPPHALLWIWRRLHGRPVETLADEHDGDA